MARLKTVFIAIFGLIVGAIMTEGFLRALIPVEAQFETWFTPGIEDWDAEFGAVYRPDWEGTMRHMDGVYRGVPLKLDENGFRPAVRNALPGEAKRVLLMGGRSLMMSYGLSEEEAIATQLAEAADIPLEAQSMARAGGNLLRNWNLFRRHLADQHWDLVVISHLNPYLPAFANRTGFDQVDPPASREWAFRYMDGILLWRDGLFLEIGRPAFQSYLGYGLIRLADSSQKTVARWKGKPAAKSAPERIQAEATAPDPAQLENYTAFLKHIRDYFSERGTPVLIHFVPRQFAEPNHHSPYINSLDDTFAVFDLHQRIHEHLVPEAFIANGHYGRELARMIGEALAQEGTRYLTEKSGKESN